MKLRYMKLEAGLALLVEGNDDTLQGFWFEELSHVEMTHPDYWSNGAMSIDAADGGFLMLDGSGLLDWADWVSYSASVHINHYEFPFDGFRVGVLSRSAPTVIEASQLTGKMLANTATPVALCLRHVRRRSLEDSLDYKRMGFTSHFAIDSIRVADEGFRLELSKPADAQSFAVRPLDFHGFVWSEEALRLRHEGLEPLSRGWYEARSGPKGPEGLRHVRMITDDEWLDVWCGQGAE